MPEKTIFIKSNLKPNDDESHPLAIFERDDRHPVQKYGDNAGDLAGKDIPGSKGEIYVSGDNVVEAFPTPGVISALKADRVVECSANGSVADTSKTETAVANDNPQASELSETEKLNEPTDEQKLDDQGPKTGSKTK